MKRLFSIIVPVYKVEKYLDRCLDSLVNQTYKNIEIILVDDGSPDKCPEMCDNWASKDSRIRVIHKDNGGLSSARNTGIEAASGEYIFFVDSDDYIDLEAVDKVNSYTEDEDFIVGEATVYLQNGAVVHRIHTNLRENTIYEGTEIAKEAILKAEWFAAACYNIYNRRFIIDNNLFFKVGILHEDNEYQPRLFLAAKKVKYMHFEFYKYVIRENSICSKPSEKNKTDLFDTYSEWKKLNDTISDKMIKSAFAGALCKAYIHTCRDFNDSKTRYPDGITKKYLLKNALNAKEFIKTVGFVLFRKIYVRL